MNPSILSYACTSLANSLSPVLQTVQISATSLLYMYSFLHCSIVLNFIQGSQSTHMEAQILQLLQSRVGGQLLLDPTSDETYREDGMVLMAMMPTANLVRCPMPAKLHNPTSCKFASHSLMWFQLSSCRQLLQSAPKSHASLCNFGPVIKLVHDSHEQHHPGLCDVLCCLQRPRENLCIHHCQCHCHCDCD